MTDSSDYPLPYAPTTDLSGEIALITGATSGLGWRFARTLAAAGAGVVACGRRRERLDELVEVVEPDGGEAVGITLDVRDAESFPRVLDEAEAALGLVTILVNNAGIPDAQYAMKMDLDLIDAVIETNIRAPFALSCEVARRLKDADRPGRIVNISSTGAFHYPGGAAALYSISKAAVNRITETLSIEWSKFRINVNAIAPGAFRSEMMDGMLERMGDFSQMNPRRRLGEPPMLDSTLLYLCAPESEAVTGAIIRVDDGQGGR